MIGLGQAAQGILITGLVQVGFAFTDGQGQTCINRVFLGFDFLGLK